ncbi:PREDICTED: probable tRNA (uracil-O(2)-)-methyltransferase [Rhagoletis zephyria]|uniref:probable tRNA (uracil-O(2)-)-methyltransferase n=1 Tax=Rhagoletis zephyria TaxID=28612 RepID=UPI00081181D1|nr:PREDICTED: probable tRNA (uracil-O(2)-)-methyltransferase [Rhagoletis zephyria]
MFSEIFEYLQMDGFLTEAQFWAGVLILMRNYHAVNRKIFACIIHKVLRVNKEIEKCFERDDCRLHDIWKFRNNVENVHETTEADMESVLHKIGESDYTREDCDGFLILFKFLTKKLHKNIEAVGKIDLVKKTYTCKFHCDHLDDFSVYWANGELSFNAFTDGGVLGKSKGWIDFVLKPKLLKWCTNPSTLLFGERSKHTKSLQLVDMEEYNELYKMLKSKYAEKAFNCWNTAKESTDPMKFIYEDLAIAAYLISLWRRVGSPIGFADLGCGNGLLVYLLSEEGFNGYGYDVRARKIWSYYSASTRLIEETIEPHKFKLPEDVDWLIGNHSDELSPWLPVLAATSGFQMRYFLLPCCAYELSGIKFQRRNTSTSVYQDFYAYLQTISQSCGYDTWKDRLKIPSTKRLALIGIDRTCSQNEYERRLEEIEAFVREERIKYGNCTSNADVKLRNRHEAVRNCTQIEKNIIDSLVLKIFHQLLSAASNIPTDKDESKWRTGIRLRMYEIVKNLERTDLQNIKAECGGIKTLLRNKHEIFEFLGEDFIGIRKPLVQTPNSKAKQTVKKRVCFFHLHHPDGCPLSSEHCTFIH